MNPNRSKTKIHHDLDPDSEAIDPEVDIKPLYPQFPGPKQHLNGGESPKKQKIEESDTWVETSLGSFGVLLATVIRVLRSGFF